MFIKITNFFGEFQRITNTKKTIYIYFTSIFNYISIIFYITLLLLLSSCSIQRLPKPRILAVIEKQFIITSSPNLSSSIILEIVQITDPDLSKRISGMSFTEYFQNREVLLEDSSLKAWSIHVPPNFHGKFQLSGYLRKSEGVFVFAFYHKDFGRNKIPLKKNGDLTKIELGPQTISSAYSTNLSAKRDSFKVVKTLN